MNDLEIKTKDLKAAFSVCKHFVSSRRIVDWTTNFVFDEDYIYATDLSAGVKFNMEYDFEDPFMITAEDFSSFVHYLDAEEVKIRFTEKQIKMKAGKTKVNFQRQHGIKQVAYPPAFEYDHGHQISEEVWNQIERAKFSMADKAENMDMCGIYIRDGYIYSTNGATATRVNVGGTLDIFLPRVLLKKLENVSRVPKIAGEQDNFVYLLYDNFVVFQRRIAAEKEVPLDVLDMMFASFEEPCCEFDFDIEAATKIVRRVGVLTDPEDRQIKLLITPDKLKVYATSEKGEVEENVDIKSNLEKGITLQIDMNADYLYSMLKLGGKLKYSNGIFCIKNDYIEHAVKIFVPHTQGKRDEPEIIR